MPRNLCQNPALYIVGLSPIYMHPQQLKSGIQTATAPQTTENAHTWGRGLITTN